MTTYDELEPSDTDAFNAGQAAYEAWESIDTNPHPYPSDEHEEWKDGWMYARARHEAEEIQ